MTSPPVLREVDNPSRGLACLELPSWQERFGLVAGITTRGPDGQFDLGLWSGTAPVGAALARWMQLRAAHAPRFAALSVSRQVHGSRIRWHERAGEGWLLLDGYDGHLTAAPGLLLAVSVADCVPVYLTVASGAVVGVVHAGWRGIAAGVLEAALDEFSTRAKVSMSEIVMHCGVSICGDCYQVGPEVILNVTGERADGPRTLDLRRQLARRAAEHGVAEVTVSPYCTRHDGALFHSHRAAGRQAGRMAAYVGRPMS